MPELHPEPRRLLAADSDLREIFLLAHWECSSRETQCSVHALIEIGVLRVYDLISLRYRLRGISIGWACSLYKYQYL